MVMIPEPENEGEAAFVLQDDDRFYKIITYGQMSGASEIPQVWDMITTNPAKAFGATGKDYGISPGNPADLILLDAETEFDALRRIAPSSSAVAKSWRAQRPAKPSFARKDGRRK